MTLGIQDAENFLGNVSGGVQQGATLQGLTTATLQISTEHWGLPGGRFNVSALQIHGQSLSPFYLDDLQTANGDEAADATRLWELWYDQAFDRDAFDIKIGQQSIDQEFITSKYSALFVNTAAGWPLVPTADLYAGGPAYPLSSLGVRAQVKAPRNITIQAGAFDDNPPGGPFAADPQSDDAGGTRFNLNTGALFIAEIQFALNPSPSAGSALPGTYKLGVWYDTAAFPDQALDTQGLSLADPDSTGEPLQHQGSVSLYGVVDQTIWQSAAGGRSLNLFARLMGAPADRNLISFSANGGLTLTDPLPGRSNDTAGIDLGVGQVSGQAAKLDRASAAPVRGTETLVELTYQAQLTPWLQLQPDAQLVLNPGGGIVNPVRARTDPPQRSRFGRTDHRHLLSGPASGQCKFPVSRQGQGEKDRRPLARAGGCPDATAMPLDDLAADREAEAGALDRVPGVQASERLEDLLDEI